MLQGSGSHNRCRFGLLFDEVHKDEYNRNSFTGIE
jgi:hypothetical protein